MKIIILLKVLKQPKKKYLCFLPQPFVNYVMVYGKMRNIIIRPTLQLHIYKGEKHKNCISKLNFRRTRKIITQLSNFASCISIKPRIYFPMCPDLVCYSQTCLPK